MSFRAKTRNPLRAGARGFRTVFAVRNDTAPETHPLSSVATGNGFVRIRSGDRVRIASVNGNVLDVGLVWIYLVELETRGSDQLPSGRIVEFPNSVVFDHTAGIFKQLPGTRFLWHEVALTMPADSDFRAMQKRLVAAVDGVFNN